MLEDVDAMKKKLMDLKHHLPEQKAPEETQAAPAEQEKEKVEEPEAPAPEKKAEEETPAPAKAEEPATAAPEKKAEEEAQPAVVSMEEEDAESKKRKLVSQSTTSRLRYAFRLSLPPPSLFLCEPECSFIQAVALLRKNSNQILLASNGAP